jgi:hypothetical protein
VLTNYLDSENLLETTNKNGIYAEEYSTVKNMNAFLTKFLAPERVSWEFIPLLTPKNQSISETILSHALQINAKIIISSTKSSGQVFGSLENRYEVGGTSNDLLRNNTTGIPVVIVPMKGRFYDELFRNNRTIDYRNR